MGNNVNYELSYPKCYALVSGGKDSLSTAQLIQIVREVLDRTSDKVLAYRPKPKTKPAKKRARLRKKAKK